MVNTCSVTNQSDAKSRKVIRNARKNNKNAILVVCGCSSQNHQDELKEIGADILIRNKELKDAINEINTLVNNGFKEIVLTGIHTGSYPNLVKLIHEISKNNKLERIRISSIEATEIDDEFLEELKNNKKICSHMHIPVQAACDNTLKQMNRKYDMNKFISIIDKIREVRPYINITTDLIVGFPSETEEDFLESYNNAKKIKFGKIHVFPYSKRDGTVAAKMNSVLSDIEKKERTHKMIELSNELENEYYNKFLGKILNVLIEEVFDNYSIGHTDNYIKVIINSKVEHNKDYNVKITNVKDITVYGEIVK